MECDMMTKTKIVIEEIKPDCGHGEHVRLKQYRYNKIDDVGTVVPIPYEIKETIGDFEIKKTWPRFWLCEDCGEILRNPLIITTDTEYAYDSLEIKQIMDNSK